MAIRGFLANQAFDPDTIGSMSLALESVCDALRLKPIDDAATRLIAERIIELAQRGVVDATTLTRMTLQEFKPGDELGEAAEVAAAVRAPSPSEQNRSGISVAAPRQRT